jgi:hypothetical protein
MKNLVIWNVNLLICSFPNLLIPYFVTIDDTDYGLQNPALVRMMRSLLRRRDDPGSSMTILI